MHYEITTVAAIFTSVMNARFDAERTNILQLSLLATKKPWILHKWGDLHF